MKFLNLTRLGSTSTGKNLVLARIQNLIFLKFFYPLKIFYDQTNFWTWINDNFIASDFLWKNNNQFQNFLKKFKKIKKKHRSDQPSKKVFKK